MFSTIIIFILVLGVLVFVHEFGHFITAKKFGAKVEEFGFGFPPRLGGIVKVNGKWKLVGKFRPTDVDYKNTIYSLNWIPVGGFVKIKGEMGENADADSFVKRKVWQRLVIIAAGVVMNIAFAAFVLSIGFGVGIPQVIEDGMPDYIKVKDKEIQIVSVLDNTPAQEGGIELGDIILSVDENEFNTLGEFSDYVGAKENETVVLKLKRGDEEIDKEIKPIYLEDYEIVGFGIGMSEVGIVSYPWYIAPWEGLKNTFYLLKAILVAFGNVFKDLFTTGKVAIEISGPVGIAVFAGKVARLGFIYLLQFTAVLSLNLAILNFLPFPALDGGRFIFLLIEGIRGKPVNRDVESIIHNIGFAILLLLVVLVTYRDFTKFGGNIIDSIKGLFGI